MQVDTHDAVGTCGLQQVEHETAGNGLAAAMLLVLARVAKQWADRGDGTRGCTLERINHDELFHNRLVDRGCVALQYEHVRATHGFGVAHVHLAVGEIVCGGLKYVGSQVFCGFLSLLGVRATRHQSQFLIRSAFENRRHACLPNCSICENKPNSNITMRVPTARGRCGSVSPYRSKLPSATSKNPQAIDAEGTSQRRWFGGKTGLPDYSADANASRICAALP